MSRVASITLVLSLLVAPIARAAGEPPPSTPGPTAQHATRLGFLPLDPVRLPGDALLLVQDELRRALAARPGLDLLAGDQMVEHLRAVRELGLSCARESAECLVQIGALANVQLLVRGVVERKRAVEVGYEALLQLWLHDARDGRVLSHVFTLLPGDPDARGRAIEDVWARLFEPEKHGNTLDIVCAEDGAEVIVDSVVIGATPLAAPLRGLATGQHVVEVRKEGHESLLSLPLFFEPGEEAELFALLPPLPYESEVPVVTRAPPLSFGNVPAATATAAVFFISVGAITASWGALENWRRNDAVGEVTRQEVLYGQGNVDVTDAGDAAALARQHGIIEGEQVPFWAVVGGGVTTVFGLAVLGAALTMWRLEGE